MQVAVFFILLIATSLCWPRFKAQQQRTINRKSTTTSSNPTTASPGLLDIVGRLANDTESNGFRLNVVYTLLQTNCGNRLREILSENSGNNNTVFLPVDEAFGVLAGIIGSGNVKLDCQGNCTVNPFSLLNNANGNNNNNSKNNTNIIQNVLSCLPEMMAYHVATNQSLFFNTSNSTYLQSISHHQSGNLDFTNVTVIDTALNGTSALVDLSDDTPQVLIANSTTNATFLNYGFQDAAMILSEPLNSTDTTAYLINRFLLPPLPLNATLLLANQTAFLNQSLLASSPQTIYTNVTLLIPLDNVLCSDGSNCTAAGNIDPNDYTIPQIIYANSSLLSDNINNDGVVNTLNNQTLQFNVTQDFNVTINGTEVAIPNVPFSGGVIHFLNGTLTFTDVTSTTANTGGTSITPLPIIGRRRSTS